MRIDSFGAIPAVTDSLRPSGGGFAEAIRDAIDRVDNAQAGAQSAAADLLVNGRGDVHTVALAAQSAELSLELFQ